MVHELKIEPEYFKDVLSGDKTFEIRENDRNYRVGDYLALNEWNAKEKKHTGRSLLARVTYMLTDERFVAEGYAVLGIRLCDVYLGDTVGKADLSKLL